VGIPEVNGTAFSDQTGPTKRNGCYHLLSLSRIPYISTEKCGSEPVCQKWNGIFQSEYSDRNKWITSRGDLKYSGRKLSIWLPTEISDTRLLGNIFLKLTAVTTYLLNDSHFNILRKSRSKFDCLLFEMLYIKKLKPTLDTQTELIRAKLFVLSLVAFSLLYYFLISDHCSY